MTADRSMLFREGISDVYVFLITLSHPSLAQPIRVVTNSENVTSNGNEFLAGRLDVTPPNISEGRPTASISIANADREIGIAAMTLLTPATITLQVVDVSDPDTIDIEYPPMRLMNVQGDDMAITGELHGQLTYRESWPKVQATKAIAPALYV